MDVFVSPCHGLCMCERSHGSVMLGNDDMNSFTLKFKKKISVTFRYCYSINT